MENVRESLKKTENNLRIEEAKVADLSTKLHTMEEIKSRTSQQIVKYKAQAESVIRALEIRLAEEEVRGLCG